MAGRVRVELLLHMMDQAFEEDGEHSLLRNLAAVPQGKWLCVPPGGSRSVRQIVGHVGACKFMYDNFAFGDARMTWDAPAGSLGCTIEELQSGADLNESEPPMALVINWMREGHSLFRRHVSTLNDADLREQRQRPEGGLKDTRWIIGVMIEHDLYHAGEINHLRALMEGNDRWAWQS